MTISETHAGLESLFAAEAAVEPEDTLRFGSRRSRNDHVRKHVLGTRSERWWDLLGQDLLDGARQADHDDGDGSRDPRFERLARAYESLLSDQLRSAVRAERHHVHIVTFEIASPPRGVTAKPMLGYRVSRRLVVAWSPEAKLRIVAGFPVSDGGPPAYTLWSGFRHDVKASVGRFTRGIRSRMLDRHRHHQERLVAIHDGEADWGPESAK
ncbi:MAG: hypothetical protein CMJ27_01505 [Phycisphaerae bacterium]|nr:hypothetical protein [Phycisphaerae bacterium]OUX03142.1 MAG: hypothetical protein CBD91_00945 [Phycisphaeraceae bacterium TMED231]